MSLGARITSPPALNPLASQHLMVDMRAPPGLWPSEDAATRCAPLYARNAFWLAVRGPAAAERANLKP